MGPHVINLQLYLIASRCSQRAGLDVCNPRPPVACRTARAKDGSKNAEGGSRHANGSAARCMDRQTAAREVQHMAGSRSLRKPAEAAKARTCSGGKWCGHEQRSQVLAADRAADGDLARGQPFCNNLHRWTAGAHRATGFHAELQQGSRRPQQHNETTCRHGKQLSWFDASVIS